MMMTRKKNMSTNIIMMDITTKDIITKNIQLMKITIIITTTTMRAKLKNMASVPMSILPAVP